MERNDIIDVTPVDQSHEQAKAQNDPARKQPAGPANRTGKPYYTFDGTSWHAEANGAPTGNSAGPVVPVNAHVIDAGGSPENGQPKSRLGGAARIAAGGVCTLVGVPMLILPGPGLLAIGGGIYLMASGAKRLFGK